MLNLFLASPAKHLTVLEDAYVQSASTARDPEMNSG